MRDIGLLEKVIRVMRDIGLLEKVIRVNRISRVISVA
jgi:hypothetical protein